MSKKQFLNNQNNIWQFTVSKWIIYVTVFLAPLYFSTSHWFLFTTPKTLLIIGGTLIALVFFIWGLIENRQESIKVTTLHYCLLAFLSILSIAGIFGVDPHTSFFGTFFSSVGIVFLIVLGLLGCLISEFVRRDFGFISRLLTPVFVSGVVVALISYLPVFGFLYETIALSGYAGSTIGNSSFAGTFLMFVVGFGVYLLLALKGWTNKLLIILGILAILFCPVFFNAGIWLGTVSWSEAFHSPLLFSGEAQGAQLGVIVLALTSLFLWFAISQKRILKIIGVSLFIFLMIGLSWSYIGLLNPASKIHQHFGEVKKGTRFVFWDISEQAIAERPFLGWGFENYQTVYQRHFDPIVLNEGYTSEEGVTNPHNIIYDMAVSSGILGLLAYLALFGFVFMVFVNFARKSEGRERLVVVFAGILLGYLVQNFFIFDTPTGYLVYFLCIGLATGLVSTRGQAEVFLKRKIIGWSTVGLLGVCFLLFVILPLRESWRWQTLRSSALSEQAEMIKSVEGISLMGGVDDDARFANELLRDVDNLRKLPSSEEERKVMFDAISSTVSLLQKDTKKYPGNFYANYEAGMLLHLAFVIDPGHDPALLDEARIFLERSRSISEQNPEVYYNLAQNELFRQNIKEAVSLIETGMAIGLKEEGQEFLKRIQR